ncbi:hypothetical protein QBC34DRAFT_388652 [Podospora aff. communis PSN243]|uniref:Uncharacterized protein n=1 Tax=Podospora aff. communis PSN243 TaxID=3040156 RepID=A0AAV9H5Q7_9PEZI|nr:hypothetical protein QBC34DRAFT_388652 [Podospora aff. communis PSN243]
MGHQHPVMLSPPRRIPIVEPRVALTPRRPPYATRAGMRQKPMDQQEPPQRRVGKPLWPCNPPIALDQHNAGSAPLALSISLRYPPASVDDSGAEAMRRFPEQEKPGPAQRGRRALPQLWYLSSCLIRGLGMRGCETELMWSTEPCFVSQYGVGCFQTCPSPFSAEPQPWATSIFMQLIVLRYTRASAAVGFEVGASSSTYIDTTE